MTIRLLITISILLAGYLAPLSAQQTHTISGYVKEQHSGELLVGVNIYLPGTTTGTTTNRYGFYSISLPADSVKLIYSFLGYQPAQRQLYLQRDTTLDVDIRSKTELETVEISGQRYDKPTRKLQMSSVKLPMEDVKKVPALLGERDVMKILQLMPGVQSSSESNNGFYVRGGGPDQNLIILDDATVYNANHLFGFFSIFNGDALKSIELIKGGFPARYGGRLSSVLDISMKDGNKRKLSGEAGIGLIASRLVVEGPIKKDTTSFLISGRRTYFDVLSRPFLPDDERGEYFFYDLNGRISHSFNRNNKLYISGYFGKDRFSTVYQNTEAKMNWGNQTATLRWNHLFNNRLFSNTSLVYSRYKLNIREFGSYGPGDYELAYSSGIKDYTLKYDIQYHSSKQHIFRAGISTTYHLFKPSALVLENTYLEPYIKDTEEVPTLESALYAEDEFRLWKHLRINAGIRLSHFRHETKSYFNTEPRLSASYHLSKKSVLKASYARMVQAVHLLTNSGIGMPSDLWVPSTKDISPQRSWQIAAGWVKDFTSPEFTLSLEAYYKESQDVKGFKEGASFLLVNDAEEGERYTWQDNITTGIGWSYGAELLIRKETGRLTGWTGYTLSWTQLKFPDLNFGRKFYARYDRRHDISIVLFYKLKDNVQISGTWVYGSGNAITLPLGSYRPGVHHPSPGLKPKWLNGYYYSLEDNGKKNAYRMAPYHRLDLGIRFHKQIKYGKRTLAFSIYNVYNRKNPFFYYVASENGKKVLKQVSLFPVIPSVSYTLQF